MKTLPSARFVLAALFFAASLPMHADDRPAGPKAGGQVWTPLYKDTLEDFRIYFRGQGYIDDVHAQKVFLAEPGQIHVINGTAGLIVTKVPYSHYHVKVDYRWGEKGGSLNAGLMTHIELDSKVVKDNRPRSIEINMRHDSPGSIWMAKGLGPFGSSFVKEGSDIFLSGKDGGVPRLIDPFKDRTVYGNYPDGKVNANPHGEWNTLEAIVRGAECVEIIHNGHMVVRVHDIREADTATKQPGAPLVSGGIGLQSEGQEVFYRNFLIRKLEHDAEEGKPDGSIDDSHVFNDAHPRPPNVVKPGDATAIPPETVREWSAPYRGWHHHPSHVIPAAPGIKGFEDVKMTDVPTVFQVPGDKNWYMSFVGFDGKGYQSFIARSGDLVHWTDARLAMGYGPEGGFDHGGVVLGGYLYDSYDIKAPRTLKNKDGKYWSLYGAYPRQGGYELRPGYEGLASSKDGLTWERAKNEPILSIHQEDCGEWEKSCIYQPWLVEHNGRYLNFYNAANGHVEQTGLAVSNDLLSWKRHPHNPVVPVGPEGSYNQKFSADPKVFRDGDHWVNFFFGVGKRGAHIMAAFSRDLIHWTVDPEPLYKAGGNPSGLDKQYAHKISLVWNPANETFYMYYNAVGEQGRGIGLITSKPISE